MSEKVSDDELKAKLRDCPRPGEAYRHYRTGAVYVVVHLAINEATQEPMVVYQRATGDFAFTRPAREWGETVEHEGRTVARFTAVYEPGEGS